jgi:hypothetical protein
VSAFLVAGFAGRWIEDYIFYDDKSHTSTSVASLRSSGRGSDLRFLRIYREIARDSGKIEFEYIREKKMI